MTPHLLSAPGGTSFHFICESTTEKTLQPQRTRHLHRTQAQVSTHEKTFLQCSLLCADVGERLPRAHVFAQFS